ncbi:uncharacterized protein BXIN_0001 [Babesia sp. Xinjiang]|uniref:uncharacterized protein n=1 Tax=Babesia sp. Xinjiang TaxID=462227 RepID=UPI000A246773|nr:uncharacterized protein BXIN_0001 [Babesia sp. Xinjiang]ORM39790.1 hypothetical protein BXIN_0001 [Babesia sp. Xinjiang]
MSPANPHADLLRRTKFAQNRTAYNTLRNTLLGVHQRKLYVVEQYELAKNHRQLAAIKKAFASRRNSRKGPFHKLLPPHVYSHLFGDPTYYSNDELCKTCAMAAEMQLTDRHFWWQITEKLRKVRDIIQISDLLRCLEALVAVKYNDQDLLRMLSREFVDDMSKLTLPEIAQLLQCYARMNVYSVDLVESAGKTAAGCLIKHVKRSVPKEASNRTDDSGEAHEDDATQWPPGTLGLLTKCFRVFGYKNRDLYLSIAYLGIKHWHNLDFYGKCALFANLDPEDFKPEPGVNPAGSTVETANEIARETTNALVRQLRNFSDDFVIKRLDSITDEVDFSAIIPASLDSSYDSYVKSMHSVCCSVGAVNNLAKVICRLAAITNNSDADLSSVVDLVMEKMVSVVARLMSFADDLHSEAMKLERGQMALSIGDGKAEVEVKGHSSVFCPYLNASRFVIVDAMMRGVCAVNAAIRLRLNILVSQKEAVWASDLKASVDDGNIHSDLYKISGNTCLTSYESAFLGHFIDTVCRYGCGSQHPELLTTALETIALSSCMESQSTTNIAGRLKDINDLLAVEAIKNLICFEDEARYRMMLALRNGNVTPNVYLEHGLRNLTKYMRKKKSSVKIVMEPPFQFPLKEKPTPVS